MAEMLLGGELGIVTSSFGLLDATFEATAKNFLEWHQAILARHDDRLFAREISGSLKETLLSLFPLVSVIRTRHLFIPTANNWTAYFDNGWRGTDAVSPVRFLAMKMGVRGIRIASVPHTMPRKVLKTTRGEYGANIIELYDENGDTQRSVWAANDGGRWVFGQIGEPFPFEDVKQYEHGRVRDRFTAGMLCRFLKHLGVPACDESFFLPPPRESSILVERHSAKPPGFKEYSLEESLI